MATDPLDIPAHLQAGRSAWAGFPEGGIIGHVHLQVGDTGPAEGFYRDILGLDIAARYPGGAAGLEAVELVARDPAIRKAIMARAERAGIPSEVSHQTAVLRDPWGTRIALAT